MNKSQKTILVLVATLLCCNFLFPPWIHTYQQAGISQVHRPAGYASIFAPPEPRNEYRRDGVVMDTSRLVVQSLVVLIAGGAAFAVGSTTRRRRNE